MGRMSKAAYLLLFAFQLAECTLPLNGSLTAVGNFSLKVSVPAYYDPDTDWQRIQNEASNIGFMIMNPNSGPGTTNNSVYQAAVAAQQAAGIKVIGYVSTQYGQRPEAQVISDIDSYYSWYNVDGIFLDEQNSTVAAYAYYQNVSNYVKNKTAIKNYVALNPGIVPNESYAAIADSLLIFEGSLQNYQNFTVPDWVYRYPSSLFFAVVYSVEQGVVAAAKSVALRTNTEYIYFTDLALNSNPYRNLPNYFESGLTNSSVRAIQLGLSFIVYPGADWTTVINSNNNLAVGFIIVEPSVGSVDTTYAAYILQMQSVGIRVFGYIAYNAMLSNMETTVDNYDANYNMDGYFISSINTAAFTPEISYNLSAYIKTKGLRKILALGYGWDQTNPEFGTSADLLSLAIVDEQYFFGYTAPAWTAVYGPQKFFDIVSNTNEANVSQVLDRAYSTNVGYIFVSNTSTADSYTSLTPYYLTEVALVEALNNFTDTYSNISLTTLLGSTGSSTSGGTNAFGITFSTASQVSTGGAVSTGQGITTQNPTATTAPTATFSTTGAAFTSAAASTTAVFTTTSVSTSGAVFSTTESVSTTGIALTTAVVSTTSLGATTAAQLTTASRTTTTSSASKSSSIWCGYMISLLVIGALLH